MKKFYYFSAAIAFAFALALPLLFDQQFADAQDTQTKDTETTTIQTTNDQETTTTETESNLYSTKETESSSLTQTTTVEDTTADGEEFETQDSTESILLKPRAEVVVEEDVDDTTVQTRTYQAEPVVVVQEKKVLTQDSSAIQTENADTVSPPDVVQAEEEGVLTAEQNKELEFRQKRNSLVLERDSIDALRDTDNDGISDFDEINIYGTDPNNANTTEDPGVEVPLTDGEKLLAGINPQNDEPIQYQDPRTSKEDLVTESYTVTTISVETEDDQVIDTLKVSRINFTGTAAPNAFVTLHIFSTPIIVTIKSDSNGLWQYQLDKELENGDHEVYVTTVDNTGKILARSPSIPFVKTAQAAGFASDVQAGVVDSSNSLFSLPIMLVAVAVFVIFVLGAITLAGSAAGGGTKGPGDMGGGSTPEGNDDTNNMNAGNPNDGVTVTERDGNPSQ